MNFISQTIFMALNDAMFLLVFVLLFQSFGTINGYTLRETMLLWGLVTAGYGLVVCLFGNAGRIWKTISEGGFDIYLSHPIDELYHALLSGSHYSGYGDMLFGLTVLLIVAPTPLLLILVPCSALLYLSFLILQDSLAFYLERPRGTAQAVRYSIIAFSGWPIDAFNARARAILYLTMLAFISTVPVHVLTAFTWAEFGALLLVCATLFTLALIVWRWGVRRYESGNAIVVRS